MKDISKALEACDDTPDVEYDVVAPVAASQGEPVKTAPQMQVMSSAVDAAPAEEKAAPVKPESNAAPVASRPGAPAAQVVATATPEQTGPSPVRIATAPAQGSAFSPVTAVDGQSVTADPAPVSNRAGALQAILAGRAPDPQTTQQIVSQTSLANPLKVDGLITRGDEPINLDPAPEETQTMEDKLTALGFPPRPAKWPIFIDWPPREIAERFINQELSDEKRRQVISLMLTLEEACLRRARQVNEWLYKNNPADGPGYFNYDSEARAMRRNLRILRETQDDPHFSIRWATLINPMSQNQAILNSVVTWSQTGATTMDGGRVLVDKDSISFSGGSRATMPYTPQSIALGIQEAKNRGWSTLKMSGSYEFAQMAIKAAKEAGIEAEITFNGKGLGSFTRHTIKVSPNLPMMDKDISEMMNKAMGDPVSDRLPSSGGAEKKVPDQPGAPSAFASKRNPEQKASPEPAPVSQKSIPDRAPVLDQPDGPSVDDYEMPPLESYQDDRDRESYVP